ncbi:MAG: AsmA-like C-terminal region-containing protein [Bryobacteraceae bacterium]
MLNRIGRAKRWLLWISASLLLILAAVAIAAQVLSRRIEPYIREQTVEYLRQRFASDVEIGSLHVSTPIDWPLRLLLRGRRGALARVTGERISLWHKHRHDRPPLVAIGKVAFDVELYSLWDRPVRVTMVRLEGLRIVVPPKGPNTPRAEQSAPPTSAGRAAAPSVIIDTIIADGSRLSVLPKDPKKNPLEFDIRKLKLESAGPGIAMRYTAVLTNPKPPGLIRCQGRFGPWVSEDPSDTPLGGEYVFENADLSVFRGIAGRLDSTGKFAGTLDNIVADGETRTPDFRLTISGNPVPLQTTYHAIIDGRNGNTLLQPVEATLGRTRFVVRGGVVRGPGESGKTVALDVVFREGYIEDLMRLAMRGPKPMMRGPIDLKVKLQWPPGKRDIADKLRLSGSFALRQAHFTSATLQDRLDALSSRAQGRPGDRAVDEVPATLAGSFRLANGVIEFSRLHLAIPGADLALTGSYTFDKEALDFRGRLRMQARVSETVTGWKRWALKMADPFFARDGAGTQLHIRIDGTRAEPRFGLDRGN